MSYDFTPDGRCKKLIAILIVLLVIALLIWFLLPSVSACTECNCEVKVNVNNILTQIAYITQQQSQYQYQTMSTAPMSGWASGSATSNPLGVVQETQTYSRLLYPGEVITYPVNGEVCMLLSGLPVGFYTIGAGNGSFKDQVQTLESVPTYDPVYHRMEFGMTPVVDKVDYWTMKEVLKVSPEAEYCVVDNRAPWNDYTTIEVRIGDL